VNPRGVASSNVRAKTRAPSSLPVTRILILSSSNASVAALSGVAGDARPDACVDDVVAELYRTLASELGYDVAHAEVGTAADLERAVRTFRPMVVFNLCESLEGESRFESVVPVMLQRLGVACTGSPADALRTCLHKFEANELLRRAGVRVPFTRRLLAGSELIALPLPAIVKPDREDGSVGIDGSSIVHDLASARARVDVLINELRQPVVVQEYVSGREISVSFLGYPTPRVLPLGEISFDTSVEGSPEILTYAAKWHPDSVDFVTTKPVAAALSPTEMRKLAACGRRAFSALGLRDYGRVDLRVDSTGEPWVIDVNPNCDLSHDGGFMRAARRAGLDRAETLSLIVRGALLRSVETSARGTA
jgi:D-alanine-D-alanine ligase